MADSSAARPDRGLLLPALARLAPPPNPDLVAAEVEHRTAPGDIVLELHGRGGWISRSAINRLRRAYDVETTPLTRLVSEVLLRPPDLLHLDAAFNAIATRPPGTTGLRNTIGETYASRCARCGEPVQVDEFIWEAGASEPSRRAYRCALCRNPRPDGRLMPVDPEDIKRVRHMDVRGTRARLAGRFPVVGNAYTLPDEVLDLFTPRALIGLAAILERIDSDLRAPSIQAALRLAFIQALLPASRLNAYPGRIGTIRIAQGHVRSTIPRQARERNVWWLFEEGMRVVRAFVQRVEGAPGGPIQARYGSDLASLLEGSANVVVGAVGGRGRGGLSRGPTGIRPGIREERGPVRLVLTQPPIHWTPDTLGFAYLATSLVLGHDAASALPLDALFGTRRQDGWAGDVASLRRSLEGARPLLDEQGSAVLLLDRPGAAPLVAGVLGGVAAGYRVHEAVLPGAGFGSVGTLELVPEPMPSKDIGWPAQPAIEPQVQLFDVEEVERAVGSIAVGVLQARGEPADYDRLVGEILVGLDRLGHLRRLVETATYAQAEGGGTIEGAPVAPGLPEQAGPSAGSAATDPVKLLLELVEGELHRPEHPRLVELEPGCWWLRDDADIESSRRPLSDRLEWTVFSLLSTTDGIHEDALLRRIPTMFRGPDAPDVALIRACLDSYRGDGTGHANGDGNGELLSTPDRLEDRYEEHGTLVGLLAEIGHRLGLRVWISRHEQRRSFRGVPLGNLLSEAERNVYLPLACPGPADALEALDVIWYLRGKACFLFEVEWTAMLWEPIQRRGPRVPTGDSVVRFLVIPSERTNLVRHKLARSPVLRRQFEEDNWHVFKADHVRRLHRRDEVSLDDLAPLLGLDPDIERDEEQLSLFV
jgi:hypothetical protein